jgi:hypothetical protein
MSLRRSACPYVLAPMSALHPMPHLPPLPTAPAEIGRGPDDLGQNLTMSHRSHLSIHNAGQTGRLVVPQNNLAGRTRRPSEPAVASAAT